MKLYEGKKGKSYRIQKINLDDSIVRRLNTIGIYQDGEIVVWQKKPSGTMIVKSMGIRWAVGTKISANIEIREAANGEH